MRLDGESRKLRILTGTRMPRRVLYLDVETEYRKKEPYIHHRMKMVWCAFCRYDKEGNLTGQSWQFFRKPVALCKYIALKAVSKRPLLIVGHNIFFDLQSSDFFYYFTVWNFKLQFFYESGLTYILAIRKDDRKIKVISSTNFFETSLKKVGELVGISKLEIDFNKSSYIDVKTYCRRDVEIVKTAMEQYFKFLVENDMGSFMVTRPSQAFHSYRRRFMDRMIKIHKNEDIKKLERKAYYGGRVECFRLGKIKQGPFITLDINSMYPYIMRNFYMPTNLINYRENVPFHIASGIIKGWCTVSEVEVCTKEPVYALRRENKLLFPIGSYTTYVCSKGLEYGLSQGHIKKILKMAIYDKDIIFNQYVDYFYNLRLKYKEEDNKIYDAICKRLLNSLYGKFGQKITLEDKTLTDEGPEYYRIDIYDLVTGKKEIEYKMFGTVCVQWGEEDAKNSFTAISAHITEYGRFLLWELISIIGSQNVLYCDTDSIKIQEKYLPSFQHLIHKTNLGALKIEEKNSDLHLIGPKAYITEKKRVIKGIPKAATEIEPYKYAFIQFYNQLTHLRRSITRYFITKEVTKTLTREYTKGIVQLDGRVTPFDYDEL